MKARYFILISGERKLYLSQGVVQLIPANEDWIIELGVPIDFGKLQAVIEQYAQAKKLLQPELIMLQKISIVHETEILR